MVPLVERGVLWADADLLARNKSRFIVNDKTKRHEAHTQAVTALTCSL